MHVQELLLRGLARARAVVEVTDVARERLLERIGVGGAGGKLGVNLVDLVDRKRARKAVVLADHGIGDAHDLAKHVGRLVGEAHVVAVALGHLAHAVGALEQRHRERHLRLHAHLVHEVTPGEQVEELVRAAHLHVGLDHHGVVGLHHGVEELVQGDGRLRLVALREVVALEDARHGELAAELEQALEVEREDPVAVVDDGGLLGVEDLHGLGDVGLGVGLDLLLRELGARGVLAARVADEGRAVADDERDLVAEVLELAHLAQRHRMAKVQVGARGVNAELDVERNAALELLAQLRLGHDLGHARGDDLHLFVDW